MRTITRRSSMRTRICRTFITSIGIEKDGVDDGAGRMTQGQRTGRTHRRPLWRKSRIMASGQRRCRGQDHPL
jgi:hypothetical protein